jgi:hypothetical protein
MSWSASLLNALQTLIYVPIPKCPDLRFSATNAHEKFPKVDVLKAITESLSKYVLEWGKKINFSVVPFQSRKALASKIFFIIPVVHKISAATKVTNYMLIAAIYEIVVTTTLKVKMRHKGANFGAQFPISSGRFHFSTSYTR